MTTITATCDGHASGVAASDWGFRALPCNTTRGLTTYTDETGFERRYCVHHGADVRKRWPELAPLACYFCKRTRPITLGTYTRINFGGSIQLVCDDCYEKGNERDEDEA